MKKVLVEAAALDSYISPETKHLYVDTTAMILTPGAKDELARRKIMVEYGQGPKHTTSCAQEGANAEQIMQAVTSILKQDLGIDDPSQLKLLSTHAMKIIKENL